MSKPVKTVRKFELDYISSSDLIESRSGTITEYKDKKALHRSDGPGFIKQSDNLTDYLEIWYERGRIHRVGGPAKTEFRKSQDGGEDQYNCIQHEWYYKGKLHRVDGPAYEKKDDNEHYLSYYQHGVLHREDGPAVMVYYCSDDAWMYRWILNGISYTHFKDFCKTAGLDEYQTLLLSLKYKFLNGTVPRSSK